MGDFPVLGRGWTGSLTGTKRGQLLKLVSTQQDTPRLGGTVPSQGGGPSPEGHRPG